VTQRRFSEFQRKGLAEWSVDLAAGSAKTTVGQCLMRIDRDHLPNFGTADSGPRVRKNERSSSRMPFRTLPPGGSSAEFGWQEPEPAAPLLEGDDAAGCDPLGE
jgi:hypothetical protein